jgi:hypothetical protein
MRNICTYFTDTRVAMEANLRVFLLSRNFVLSVAQISKAFDKTAQL